MDRVLRLETAVASSVLTPPSRPLLLDGGFGAVTRLQTHGKSHLRFPTGRSYDGSLDRCTAEDEHGVQLTPLNFATVRKRASSNITTAQATDSTFNKPSPQRSDGYSVARRKLSSSQRDERPLRDQDWSARYEVADLTL